MKIQRDLQAWVSRKGTFRLLLPSPQVKGFVVTDGASISVEVDGEQYLVASGRGSFTLDLVVSRPGELVVEADKASGSSSVHLLGWGPTDQPAGFLDTPSFVQLDAKSRNAIPADVQAMFDLMQRNALLRENALRSQLEKFRSSGGV